MLRFSCADYTFPVLDRSDTLCLKTARHQSY